MQKSELKCLYWNIHGIYSKILGEKNKDPHFLSIIQGFDVIAISELHTKVNIAIPGFLLKKQKFRPKNHKGPKIGGGIAVFIRQEIEKNFRLIPNDSVDSIWLRTSVGQGEDETRLGFFYCSPEKKDSNFFEPVNEEIEKHSNRGSTYIFGDFNARTKNVCENIARDKTDESLGIEVEMINIPTTRNSQDLKTINKRGHDFLDICRVNDLTIANGRVLGDLYGRYTCHQKRGSSVVDYLIAPHKALENVKQFKVGEYTPLLSDHTPIMATIGLDRNLSCEEAKEIEMNDLPKRKHWEEEHIASFREKLNSDQYKEQVSNLLNREEVVTIEEVKTLLLSVDPDPSDNEPGRRPGRKRKGRKDQPWFDNECRSLKREITECGKTLRSAPDSTTIRERIFCLKKTLRNQLRKKKNAFQTSIVDDMCQDMSNGDKKKYWRQLKRLEGARDNNKYIPDYTLINHFKEILHDDRIKLEYQHGTRGNGDLDYEITEKELKAAAKILKLGKGIGIDRLYNEMIRPLVEIYPKLIARTFNDLLSKRQQIGKDWLHSLVTAIHKKGAKEDPDNYRGISLMSCLGKLFLTIINNRLTEFCLHKGLLSPSQLGFVKGNRTSDPHIILNNILQKYCHKSNKRIYGCFVDFSKAFDSVYQETYFSTN